MDITVSSWSSASISQSLLIPAHDPDLFEEYQVASNLLLLSVEELKSSTQKVFRITWSIPLPIVFQSTDMYAEIDLQPRETYREGGEGSEVFARKGYHSGRTG
jgi:hypothetical protein